MSLKGKSVEMEFTNTGGGDQRDIIRQWSELDGCYVVVSQVYNHTECRWEDSQTSSVYGKEELMALREAINVILEHFA